MGTLDHAFFYNSQDHDRVYDASSFEYWLKKFFTSGVFTGDCQVTADGAGMTVEMSAGYCNCDGKVRFFADVQQFALANAHSTYDRIDTIVIERNDSDRDITVKVVTGNYAADPQPTAPVRANGIYQLVVAEILVAAGATRIYQGDITDKRPDTSVCGYVLSAVQTPDFSELYAQFQAQAAAVVQGTESDLDEWETEFKATADNWYLVETDAFAAWFESIRGQLDEDAAGHLQNEIDDLNSDVSSLSDKIDDLEGKVGPFMFRYEPDDGHLYMDYTADYDADRWSVNSEGHLIYTF